MPETFVADNPPAFIMDGLLEEAESRFLYYESLAKRDMFKVGRLTDGATSFTDFSRQVAFDLHDTSSIAETVLRPLSNHLTSIAEALRIDLPSEVTFEHKVHAYGNGGYIGPHTDTDRIHKPGRLITLLHYFGKAPKVYAGGDLILYSEDLSQRLRINTEVNMTVAFRSNINHEVEKVKLESNEFKDFRFCFTAWIKAG